MSYGKKLQKKSSYDTIQASIKIPNRFHDVHLELHNPEVSDEDYGRIFESRIEEESEKFPKKEEPKPVEEKPIDKPTEPITVVPPKDRPEFPEDVKRLYIDADRSVEQIADGFKVPESLIYETLAKQRVRFSRDRERKELLKSFTSKQLKEWGYEPSKEEESKIEREGMSVGDRVKELFPSGIVGEGKKRSRTTEERGYTGSSSLWEKDLD